MQEGSDTTTLSWMTIAQYATVEHPIVLNTVYRSDVVKIESMQTMLELNFTCFAGPDTSYEHDMLGSS